MRAGRGQAGQVEAAEALRGHVELDEGRQDGVVLDVQVPEAEYNPAPERSEGAEVLKMAIREATFHPGEGRARKGVQPRRSSSSSSSLSVTGRTSPRWVDRSRRNFRW